MNVDSELFRSTYIYGLECDIFRFPKKHLDEDTPRSDTPEKIKITRCLFLKYKEFNSNNRELLKHLDDNLLPPYFSIEQEIAVNECSDSISDEDHEYYLSSVVFFREKTNGKHTFTLNYHEETKNFYILDNDSSYRLDDKTIPDDLCLFSLPSGIKLYVLHALYRSKSTFRIPSNRKGHSKLWNTEYQEELRKIHSKTSRIKQSDPQCNDEESRTLSNVEKRKRKGDKDFSAR